MTDDMPANATLAKVVAELEIRNLVARVAQLADHGEDLEEYGRLFTEDGAWEFPAGPRRGRADIVAGAHERRRQKVTGPGSHTRHLISTVSVVVHDDATATADSYWQFWRDTADAPALFNMGHYHDSVRHEDGSWRLARREITLG